MSQETLSGKIGVAFQQLQKYERGANRISAGRLWELSQALDVPISFFFDDVEGGTVQERQVVADETADLSRREILELARAFDRIKRPVVRKRLLELVKSVGRDEG